MKHAVRRAGFESASNIYYLVKDNQPGLAKGIGNNSNNSQTF